MTPSEADAYLTELQSHLRDELLPYWREHGDDDVSGGYLTFFDKNGEPTGETTKNLLAHARLVYTFAAIHRAGHDPGGAFLEKAERGVRFMLEHFEDGRHRGWFWTANRHGAPLDRKKLVYGHAFAIYGLSEYAMAANDSRALAAAGRTFDLLQRVAADNHYGGYYEFFEQNWDHCRPGRYGGDRKSFDVHMHLMEAFTNLFEASDDPIHGRKASEIVELIVARMLHPAHGTGIAQFTVGFSPVRQIQFENVWGSDRPAEDPDGRPLDNTSYGHNVEFGWLLHHAINILGLEPSAYANRIRRLYEHCCAHGIDRERGGVFCEGPHRGEARERNKEFWQQAEALVAMLDGVAAFGDPAFADAYGRVHRFVFDHVIHHDVGEWYALLGPDNQVTRDYLGHAWKTGYHTVRAMLECERRLQTIRDAGNGGDND